MKNPYYYVLLLLFIVITTSFSSVKGWCVDKGNGSATAHIRLSDCHSVLSVCDESGTFDVEVAHSKGNKNCQTCLDVTPAVFEVKLSDDSFGSLFFSPLCDSIFSLQQHSDIETFAIASLNDRVAIDKSFSHQDQQNKALRTTVLLI